MTVSTRLHNSLRLSLIRAIWGVSVLVSIVLLAATVFPFQRLLELGGIGVTFARDDATGKVILQVHPDGAAAAVGILTGDKLLVVDGQAVPALSSPTTLGEFGSTVVLCVQTQDAPPRDYTLRRTDAAYGLLAEMMRQGISRDVGIGIIWFFEITALLFFWGVALMIFWRRSNEGMAVFASLLLFVSAVRLSQILIAVPDSLLVYPPILQLIFFVSVAIGLYFFFLIFPNGKWLSRWSLFAFGGYVVYGGAVINLVYAPSLLLIDMALFSIVIGLQVFRYFRVSTPIQRQQTKWVLVGFTMALIGFYLTISPLPPALDVPIYIFSRIAYLTVPLTLALAILRYRLYDVDLVINRGLVFGSITLGLSILFFMIFYGIQMFLSMAIGSEQNVIAVGAAGAITAVLFNPTRQRVQNIIDRRFYGLRFDLNQLQQAQKAPNVKNHGIYTGQNLGGFELQGVIGRGGMGEIYWGVQTGRVAAVKILPADLAAQPEYRTRFEREATAIQTLQHPQIVHLYASGEKNGIAYIAMEYVEGQDLRSLLRERGKLSLEEIQPFIVPLAAALDYAHARGFVHRDIKPANIMMRNTSDEKQEAVLMDFGIARLADVTSTLTGTGAVGTIDYMAPEQILASHEVDHRADIYALGVVLYEILTGERPFKGGAAQVMFAHLQQPAPDPRSVNPQITPAAAMAIMKALAKDPTQRFASAGELAEALQH